MDYILPQYIKPPCKDCADRDIGCHARCVKYLAYRAELDDIKEKIAEESAGAAVASRGIWKNRHSLRCTEAGRKALSQR